MAHLIINELYLDRVISDCKSEQKLILQTNVKLEDDVLDKDNKYIGLLSDMITMSLKLKASLKPRDDKSKKVSK